MTRAEKISKIKDLAERLGFVPLPQTITINGRKCTLVDKHGIMEDICGDWCLVGMFEGAYNDGEISIPELTDGEVDAIYSAVQNYCLNILYGIGTIAAIV